jgi:hypothetical protein
MKSFFSLLFFLLPFSVRANVVDVAGYQFVAPDDWQQSTPSSSMRKAQFDLKTEAGATAELVFFYFGPSGGGGVRANLDRWIKQFRDLQKSDVSEDIVEDVKVTFARTEGTFLSGSPFGPKTPKPGYALLGAIVEGREGSIFLKLIGEKNAVLEFEDAVLAMIRGALTRD